eukprot:6188737-Pleurochrysis_carterae.AAC.2
MMPCADSAAKRACGTRAIPSAATPATASFVDKGGGGRLVGRTAARSAPSPAPRSKWRTFDVASGGWPLGEA